MGFEKLFEPIKIGPTEIKNRLAVAPMNLAGDRSGHPTRQYSCYFNARALGGFGLLTTGSILTNKESHEECGGMTPGLYVGSKNYGYYSDFTDSVHSQGTGAKIFAQLSIGFGRQTGMPGAKGASAIPLDPKVINRNLNKGQTACSEYWFADWGAHYIHPPREMTIEEIKADERTYVESAAMAIAAGFDGIEVHAPHGYLVHQFLSARSNQRKDEYGGSLKNRARLLLNLVGGLKGLFGDAVPIMVRLSGREYHEGGNSAEDVRQICRWCVDAGADAISLSNGSGYDDMKHFMPVDNNPELMAAQGKKLRDACGVPVIHVGLNDPAVACKAVEDGETDMITLGRASLCDPEWPNKVKEGRIKEIVKCIKCEFCNGISIQAGRCNLRCSKNPRLGVEENFPEYWPKAMKATVPEALKRWKPGKMWKSTLGYELGK
ncbi:MAG: NADH:flavin oxidoreductase [Pseudomonadota bacterium]